MPRLLEISVKARSCTKPFPDDSFVGESFHVSGGMVLGVSGCVEAHDWLRVLSSELPLVFGFFWISAQMLVLSKLVVSLSDHVGWLRVLLMCPFLCSLLSVELGFLSIFQQVSHAFFLVSQGVPTHFPRPTAFPHFPKGFQGFVASRPPREEHERVVSVVVPCPLGNSAWHPSGVALEKWYSLEITWDYLYKFI